MEIIIGKMEIIMNIINKVFKFFSFLILFIFL